MKKRGLWARCDCSRRLLASKGCESRENLEKIWRCRLGVLGDPVVKRKGKGEGNVIFLREKREIQVGGRRRRRVRGRCSGDE